MNQSRYIKKISKFCMEDCKSRLIPCEMDIKKISDEVDLINHKSYRDIIGRLIYIMVATRSDIFNTVTSLSKTLMKAKHILRYLKAQSINP